MSNNGQCFLHFSTWPDTRAMVGSPHVIPGQEPNQYWKNKLAGLKPLGDVDSSAPTLQNADGEQLVSLAPMISRSKVVSEVLKEFVFEDTRRTFYPHRPSRQHCLFLFDPELDPDQYGQLVCGDTAAARPLVEVEVLGGSLHRAAIDLLNCNSRGYGGLLSAAHEYWGTSAASSMNSEVLFVGSFRIRRILREPRAG